MTASRGLPVAWDTWENNLPPLDFHPVPGLGSRAEGDHTARKRYTAEQIIGHLRQAEIRISEGKTVAEVVRELGVSQQTYYRWRKEYGGMGVE